MSVLAGIVKVAAAVVAVAFGAKTGKKGYQDIKTKISSNKK